MSVVNTFVCKMGEDKLHVLEFFQSSSRMYITTCGKKFSSFSANSFSIKNIPQGICSECSKIIKYFDDNSLEHYYDKLQTNRISNSLEFNDLYKHAASYYVNENYQRSKFQKYECKPKKKIKKPRKKKFLNIKSLLKSLNQ